MEKHGLYENITQTAELECVQPIVTLDVHTMKLYYQAEKLNQKFLTKRLAQWNRKLQRIGKVTSEILRKRTLHRPCN